MSIATCIELVARGDPDRWRTAMLAPPEKRAGLMTLYAFNLEIARAPWVASEPMLAEIRLRWWHDAVAEIYADAVPRRHEVVEPLAKVIRSADLPQALFEETIAARLADAAPVPLPDRPALDRYLTHTAGHLMELAARHLGAPSAALPVVRDFAQGVGIASYLRALPELEARGRRSLPPDVSIDALAHDGLVAIAQARRARRRVPAAVASALLPGWQAAQMLKIAVRDPERVRGGGLATSEIRARAGLAARALSGRW